MNTILFPKCCFNCKHLCEPGYPACDICFAAEKYIKWEPVVENELNFDKEMIYG